MCFDVGHAYQVFTLFLATAGVRADKAAHLIDGGN